MHILFDFIEQIKAITFCYKHIAFKYHASACKPSQCIFWFPFNYINCVRILCVMVPVLGEVHLIITKCYVFSSLQNLYFDMNRQIKH